VSGLRMALVATGVAITLPAFVIGAEVVSSLGAVDGVIAVLLAGLVLAVIASLMMLIAARTRLGIARILAQAFGLDGAKWVAAFIALTLLGWFGVTLSLFGQACADASVAILGWAWPGWIYQLIGGALMISITVNGFAAMDLLSRLVVPALMIMLLIGAWLVLTNYSVRDIVSIRPGANSGLADIPSAISALVGGYMVGVTISPDYARYARSTRDGVLGAVLSFGLGYQLVLLLSGLPALVLGSNDFVANISGVGMGVSALFIVVFATLTTNVANLYSTSLGVAQSFPGLPDWLITVCLGLLGIFGALLGIMDYFVKFLLFLGIAVPPVCGICLAEYFGRARVLKPDQVLNPPAKGLRVTALMAWLLASAVVFIAQHFQFSLLGVYALDAVCLGALLYLVFSRFAVRGQS